MSISIFKSGEKSSFTKKSRKMAQMICLGASSLSLVFCLFIFNYFNIDDAAIGFLSISFFIAYLLIFLISFTKLVNKKLYELIFIIFIYTSLSLIYIAFKLSFNSEFIILMLAIFNVILFALPKPKQVLVYFAVVFIPLIIALLMSSEVNNGFSLLITVAIGYVFALSYVISFQKKKLGIQVKQNAEILKTLLNNTNDAVFLIDYYSKSILDVNEQTKVLFKLNDTSDIYAKKYYELFSDKNFINSLRNEITQQLSLYGFYQVEALFKRQDGSIFWGNMLLSPFEAVSNNYYLIQIKDINKQKKNENVIKANNDRFKFIIENLDEFIYLVSYNNNEVKKIEYLSPFVEKIFGITKDEYLLEENRNKLKEAYHPDDIDTLKSVKEKLLSSKRKLAITYRVKPVGKDDYISISETIIPKLDDKGEIIEVLGVLREI